MGAGRRLEGTAKAATGLRHHLQTGRGESGQLVVVRVALGEEPPCPGQQGHEVGLVADIPSPRRPSTTTTTKALSEPRLHDLYLSPRQQCFKKGFHSFSFQVF